MPSCPQCGAPLTLVETCQEQFHLGQLKEVADPHYYAVHHLSVLSYMLQHNAYSREGWLHSHTLLQQFVQQNLDPQFVRRRDRDKVDSGQRNWSLTKGPKLPGVEQIVWHCTVADVRLDTAEHYCADVRRWAVSVLADAATLLQG